MAHEPRTAHDSSGRVPDPQDAAAGEAFSAPAGRGLSVLFATHNGARTLPRMLAALTALEPPKRPWRIIAVDNASTDESAELLRAAAERLPMVVLACPTPGKMPALILGAGAVSGDLVVFTDDDVEPAPGWLRAYEAAAERHPEVGLFGGPITPVPIDPVSAWFEASRGQCAELFAHTELGDELVDDASAHIFGPNFMLRRAHVDLLERVGTALGPTFADGRSRHFPMGEDTLLMMLAREDGVLARGVAGAAVRHLVRAYQTELDFMLDRAIRHGRGWAIRYVGIPQPSLRRRIRLLALGLSGSLRPARPEAPGTAAFARLWRVYWMRGVLLGAARGPFTLQHAARPRVEVRPPVARLAPRTR